MNAKILIVLVAVLAIASAGKLSNARHHANHKTANSEAHFHALKNSPFGKNLFNMMSLKLKTSGDVDAVIELLNELEANIQQQQSDDEDNYNTVSAQYQDTINSNNAIIANDETNIQAWNAQIESDTEALSQAQAQVASLTTEADNINDLLTQLAQIRAAENAAFLQRQSDQQAILAGLGEVISLFSNEVENDPNLDQESAQNVLDLLNEIQASVQASLADDAEAENAAQTKYNNFVADRQARLEAISESLDELNTEIDSLNSDLATQTANVQAATAEETNAQEIVQSTTEALDALTATYTANTNTRSDQVTLITQVKARLSSAESAGEFLSGSASGSAAASSAASSGASSGSN